LLSQKIKSVWYYIKVKLQWFIFALPIKMRYAGLVLTDVVSV